MLWKNISPKLLSLWKGVDLGRVTKEQNSPVFVTGTYFCPRPAPSPKVLLWIPSPVGHGHALPNLLLNRRLLFYSRRSLCSKQALRVGAWRGAHQAHGHPRVPALCFVLSSSSRERTSGAPPPTLKFFSPSWGTRPQFLKSVPKLPTSDQLVIPLNISFTDFWKDSLSTLLTST